MLDDLTGHHANVFKKHSWQNNNEVQVVQICTFLQAHNPRGSASPEFFQVLKKKNNPNLFCLFGWNRIRAAGRPEQKSSSFLLISSSVRAEERSERGAVLIR